MQRGLGGVLSTAENSPIGDPLGEGLWELQITGQTEHLTLLGWTGLRPSLDFLSVGQWLDRVGRIGQVSCFFGLSGVIRRLVA